MPWSSPTFALVLSSATNDWSWNDFISTTLATLIGAAIGAAAVFLGLRYERAVGLANELDNAAIDLVLKLGQRAYSELQSQAKPIGSKSLSSEIDADGSALGTSLEILILRAKAANDRSVATALWTTVTELEKVQDRAWACRELSSVQRLIRNWRGGVLKPSEMLGFLQVVDNRRALKHAGTSESQLPRADF